MHLSIILYLSINSSFNLNVKPQLKKEDSLKIKLPDNNDKPKVNIDAASNVPTDSYDRYKQIKLLGFGAFGHVYQVIDTQIKFKDEEAQFVLSYLFMTIIYISFSFILLFILK